MLFYLPADFFQGFSAQLIENYKKIFFPESFIAQRCVRLSLIQSLYAYTKLLGTVLYFLLATIGCIGTTGHNLGGSLRHNGCRCTKQPNFTLTLITIRFPTYLIVLHMIKYRGLGMYDNESFILHCASYSSFTVLYRKLLKFKLILLGIHRSVVRFTCHESHGLVLVWWNFSIWIGYIEEILFLHPFQPSWESWEICWAAKNI